MSNPEQSLRLLSERIKEHSSQMSTEEAVKTSIVLPFLSLLGFDVFNPLEVIPEFTADAVGKKGEKVDYAIKIDDDIQILIECKPIATTLEKKHLDQLYRYFSVTKAKFAILTNGRTFNFYTDLEEPNKLDTRPFMIFEMSDLQPNLINELRKFEKSSFDVDAILATAERLKYTSSMKREISALIESPTEEFVKLVAGSVYDGRLTAQVKEMLMGIAKVAFREVIMDSVKSRLNSALADTEPTIEENETTTDKTEEIITTEEEREGYMIAKAIAREVIAPSRIFIRDARSYCAVLVDNNNRKPLARLHLNRSVKYLGLFDNEVEDKVLIGSLDDIYNYAERIRKTAAKYVDS
ncbi:restriction endonuclease [Pseudohoeflea suaedae]|uniref:Restriction endonuclease n=1 Tax=Pseudohoeflea suaedae TaxID=877384 RepID=A0A4V3A7L5_9HYPH|nr:type I restriction endonuclease [Pseudohoeflea suaedae]TDH39235.1 restriction endonuclease [Pseudohoeflea suaedae]